MTARARRDPEGRKRAIVAATCQVIAEHGVAGVNHRRIAATAGVPLGSTTQHFSSRDALLRAAMEELSAQYEKDLEELGRELSESTQPLRAVARYMLSYSVEDERSRAATAFFLADLQSPGVQDLTRRWYARQTDVLRARFGEAFARAAGTFSYGLFVQYAQHDPLPTEEELTQVLGRLAGQD